MDSASALEEFLRPPPPLRHLKRETEVLAMANHAEVTLRPGTENPEERITYYRWGSPGRRAPRSWLGRESRSVFRPHPRAGRRGL
jgi:hypothetical protein